MVAGFTVRVGLNVVVRVVHISCILLSRMRLLLLLVVGRRWNHDISSMIVVSVSIGKGFFFFLTLSY